MDYDMPEPRLNSSTANVVVVDSLPAVPMKKYQKLCSVVRKIFGDFGKIEEDGIYMPAAGEEGKEKTLGYAFIEYKHPEMAAKAVARGDGKKLDAKHILKVNLLDDIDSVAKVSDEYVAPSQTEFDDKINLSSRLYDEELRDQFLLRYQNETKIFWHDPHKRANYDGRELQYGGEQQKQDGQCWTELYTAWSSQGTYLATFHSQGVVLWGGEKFEKLVRLSHPKVKVVDFSPCERYIVTCTGEDKVLKNDPDCIVIWDVKSGKKLRGFEGGESLQRQWPVFKWSHDGKYFARVAKDKISVYEAPGMGLLDKKSINIPGVVEFDWSPTANIISYWVPEINNIPAGVGLIAVPSKEIIRENKLYQVTDIKMHWQKAGDYLSVKITRKKTKKTLVTNFEIFRMNQKNIPVEVLEMPDEIIAFCWEPRGPRFAVAHRKPNAQRACVSFYLLQKKKLKLMKTVEDRACNAIFWAPFGGSCILAGLGQMQGQLEFFDVNTMTVMANAEHYRCNEVHWDPSGRYLLTASTQTIGGEGNWKAEMDNGYRTWTSQGDKLHTFAVEQLYQATWRPRPPTLLTKEQQKSIEKSIKAKYWDSFEKMDSQIRRANLTGEAKQRDDLKSTWKSYRAECEAAYKANKSMRVQLRHGLVSDDEDDYEEVEQVVEEELERKEEVVEEVVEEEE